MNLQRKCQQLYKPDIVLAKIDPTLEPETGVKGELDEGKSSIKPLKDDQISLLTKSLKDKLKM